MGAVRERESARRDNFKTRLLGRKLSSSVQKSPYLAALKLLTVAGYDVFLDESTDCPHLVVDLDHDGELAAIITFESDSAYAIPVVFLRHDKELERIEVDPVQWVQSGGNLASLVAALRNARS